MSDVLLPERTIIVELTESERDALLRPTGPSLNAHMAYHEAFKKSREAAEAKLAAAHASHSCRLSPTGRCVAPVTGCSDFGCAYGDEHR